VALSTSGAALLHHNDNIAANPTAAARLTVKVVLLQLFLPTVASWERKGLSLSGQLLCARVNIHF
jgi:hypothetical protein